MIKSIGTDRGRWPHTGVQIWEGGVRPIPAAALSVADAEQLDRVLARGKPVTLYLVLTPRMIGTRQSGNVVADVPGRDRKAAIVLIGGHLDSWDLGTGAIDDAAGVAITAAAAKQLLDGPRPLRTIRLVWFGAEEVGGFGGIAYARAHGTDKHVLVAEADFGADRIWRWSTRVADPKVPVMRRLDALLTPLGISRGDNDAHGGTDIAPLAEAGVPVIDLAQDGMRYFDWHHTPEDTLDKIDPAQIAQVVAAWTTMLAVIADEPSDLAPPVR